MSVVISMAMGVPMAVRMGGPIGISSTSRSSRSKPRAPVKPPMPPTPRTLQEWVRNHEHRSTVSQIPANFTYTEGQKVPKRPENSGARRLIRRLKHLLESDSVEHHYSGGGPSQTLKVSNNLSRGETLKSVSTEEWTNNLFNWRVTVVHQIPGWKHPARVTFYSVNLQRLLINGTDWSRAAARPGEYYTALEGDSWVCREEWYSWQKDLGSEKVLIQLRHEDESRLQVDRSVFRPVEITNLVIDQRMGSTTYREVARFGDGIYGNDLIERKVLTWKYEQRPPQELVDFIKPLYPLP